MGIGKGKTTSKSKESVALAENQGGQSPFIPVSNQEKRGQNVLNLGFEDLTRMLRSGPGQSDVEAGYSSQQGLAELLDSFAAGGFLPKEEDFSAARSFASEAFQGQQVALDQSFEREEEMAAREAARLGRDPSDPILRAKLARSRSEQQQLLSADQGSFASQFAQSLPMQRLGFAQDATSLRAGLASQAMANRQALAGLGASVRDAERNFRLQGAQRAGTNSQQKQGGIGDTLGGALALGGAVASGGASLGLWGAAQAAGGGNGGFDPGGAAPSVQNSGGFSMPALGQSSPFVARNNRFNFGGGNY